MRNRSKEELEAILQTFPDVFEDQTGKTLTKEAIVDVIVKILIEKEAQLIKQRFYELSIRDLRCILAKVNDQPSVSVPSIPEGVSKVIKRVKKHV